jgi:outer membrane immunogenic protein
MFRQSDLLITGKGFLMKRLAVAIGLGLITGSAALAADIPPPPPPPRAPAAYIPVAPPPLYSWTGFYLGPNIGWGFGGLSGVTDTLGSTFANTTQQSFLGGGQVGFNWQFWGGVVIGAEAQFDWLPNASNTLTATAPGGSTATVSVNNRWLTLADARLGYAFDRLLVYGKGGGAFIGTSNSGVTIAGVPFGLSGTSSSNTGWNAGVGLEWAFAPAWSARVEYDYIRMNSATYTVAATAPAPFGGDVISSNNRTYNLVTLGLNYKFGGGWW